MHSVSHWYTNMTSSKVLSGRTRTPYQCTQRAGDIVFVPTLWAHGTFNVQQSIGVAHEFSTEAFCMQ